MTLEFTSPLDQFENSDLWGYHFLVPDEVAEEIVSDNNRRVVCTVEGKLSFHCALMPIGNGGWFIMVNKPNRKKLGLLKGQVVRISLEKDHSEYGLPMPEELGELLLQDDSGSQYFHALTPGKQRSLIYIVSNVKSSEIRLRRAFVVVEHLKRQAGKVDSKVLSKEMKEANQQYNRR